MTTTRTILAATILAACSLRADETNDHAVDDAFHAEIAALAPTPPPPAPEPQLMEALPGREPILAAAPSVVSQKGAWSSVIAWTPHVPVTGAVLPDGRLLTFASNQRNAFPTGPEFTYAAVWNPATGAFTEINNNRHDMFCGGTAMLPDGRVLINGGRTCNRWSSAFDWRTNQWTAIQNMNDGRWYNTSVVLPDGRVFTASGTNGERTTERWTAATGWARLTGIDWNPVLGEAGFDQRWHPHLMLAPDGRLFHSGPTDTMRWVNLSGNGSLTNAGPVVPGTHFPKEGSFTMYDEGKILVAGGFTTPAGSAATKQAYTVNINGTPTVTVASQMINARAFGNSVILPNGEVMVVGGNTTGTKFNDGGAVFDTEIWNPTTGQWRVAAAISVPRTYHSLAFLLPDGRVWSGGGGLAGNAAVDHPDAQTYIPAALFNSDGTLAPRPVISAAPERIGPGVRFTVRATPGLARFTFIRLNSQTHSVSTDLRFLELPATEVEPGKYELTARTNLNVMLPGYWMLFALDGNQVFSVSKVIQVVADASPTVTNPGQQTSEVGSVVSLQINAAIAGTGTLGYTATGLPAGLSIHPTSGVISGSPTTPGSTTVSVTVTSTGAPSSIITFPWTIATEFSLSLTGNLPKPAGSAVALAAASAGGVNPVYSWSFGDGTPDSLFSPLPSVSHTFPGPGRYLVTVTVKDDLGRVRSKSFRQAIHAPLTSTKPATSAAIAYDTRASGNPRVWVVNPDNDSVTVLDAVTRQKAGEVAVAAGPRTLAIAPDGRVWVTCVQAGRISIINPTSLAVAQTITLHPGARPFGIAFSPNGAAAWVACEGSGQLLRLNPSTGATIASVPAGINIRHVSVSADSARVLASRFITPRLPGEDTATPQTSVGAQKLGGEVVVISTATNAVTSTAILEASERPDTATSARGIPNYLGAPIISPDGLSAWVPSKQDNIQRGSFRDGQPLNHDRTVRAVATRLDLSTLSAPDANRVDFDDAGMPSAAAWDPYGMYLFVALEASRQVAVVDAWSRTEFVRFDVGRAPQGLVLSPDGATLFVHNFMDRTVSVHDVSGILAGGQLPPTAGVAVGTVATERLSPQVLLGKKHFYDARDPRIALQSYISCASCHNDGDSDGRVWDLTGFGEGLRNTITLRGHGGTAHGPLHWSENFDEIQDFENQIRSLNAGTGLLSAADFAATQATLGTPKAGRSADLDALAAYVSSLTSQPASPHRNSDGSLTADALLGQQVFRAQNCAQCHGGVNFTDSAPSSLHDIGTLRAGSGQRLGGNLAGIDSPSLRGAWATAPYLHNGRAATLGDAVLAHSGVTLTATELSRLVAYLQQIDGTPATPPLPFTVALSAPAATVSGAFTVTATFSDPATGVSATDFVVGNGTASALTGTGTTFTITITPTAQGTVTVSLPAGIATEATGLGNAASNVLSVSYSTGAPAPLLADDFNDNTPNAGRWTTGAVFGTTYAGAAGFDSGILVAERNQRLEIVPRSNMAGDRYAGLVSASTVNFTGASASVEVVQAAGGHADTLLCVSKDSQNFALMVVEGGVLYIDHAANGARDFSSHSYSAAQDRFWRIRHTAGTPGTIAFETSADSATWHTLRTENARFALTAVRVEIGAGTWQAESAPGMAVFDNFSLTLPAPGPANQAPVARPSGPYIGTTGASVAFSGTTSSDQDGTIAAYAWNFGDNSTATTASPSHTYSAAGTYTVTLTVTDNAGATHTATTTATIANPANQLPVARAGGPYNGTAGTAVALNGSTSSDADGTLVAYNWNFGDNTTGTGAAPTHTYAAAGTYTVALTVTDNSGASHTASTTVTIAAPANQPPVARAGGPYSGTRGVGVAFNGSNSSDPDGSIASYLWSFGDNTTATGASPSHIYAATGTFTVSLTVTDNAGASHTATTTAVITAPSNQAPVAVPGGPYGGAIGQAIAFDGSASTDPDGTIAAYEWRMGDTTRLTTVLTDDFTDNTRDAAKWSVGAVFGTVYAGAAGYDPAITVAERSTRVEITPRTGQSGDRYAGYVSATATDFTGGAASVEVQQVAGGFADTLLCVSKDSQNFALMVAEGGGLYCIQSVNGAFSVSGIGYNATQHRHWRIRHAAPSIVFEASANGSSWAVIHSEPARFALTSTRVELGAGTWQPESAPGLAVFDNFKLTRTATGPETILTGSTVSHSYTSPGTFVVTLKVTDNSGATNEATTTVSVGSSGSIPGSLALNAGDFRGPQQEPAAGASTPQDLTLLGGKWTAIAHDTLPAHLSLVVTPNGMFTGQLRVRSALTTLRGRLAADGTAALAIARKGQSPLRIQLALDSTTHRLRGAIHDDALLAELDGDHALFTAARVSRAPFENLPAGWLGKSQMRISATTVGGALTLTVSKDGTARLTGRLGKWPLTAAAPVSREGDIPLFSRIAPANECLAGWLQLPSTSSDTPIGSGRWFRVKVQDELFSALPAE